MYELSEKDRASKDCFAHVGRLGFINNTFINKGSFRHPIFILIILWRLMTVHFLTVKELYSNKHKKVQQEATYQSHNRNSDLKCKKISGKKQSTQGKGVMKL